MNSVFYLIAVVFIVLWAIGYFGYNAGEFIHLLIVIAIISLLIRAIKGNKLIK